MFLYRIAKKPFHEDLTGVGARLFGGRWNSEGVAVLYLSSNPSLAALEVLAHTPMKFLYQQEFMIVKVMVPEDLSIQPLTQISLPEGWESPQGHPDLKQIGDAWVERMRHPLLRVPSVMMPGEWNFLLNPAHPKSTEVYISAVKEWLPDPRLLEW